jgi:hypothetical protein
LFSISEHPAPSRKQLRSFGLILAAGFLVIAGLPVVVCHGAPRVWSLVFSAAFLVTGLFIPETLPWVYKVWMALGDILGSINSKIVLGLLFYLVVTPVRLFIGFTGRDPMNRNFDKNTASYRVDRKARPVSHMNHQF